MGPAPQTLRPIFKDREEEAAGASIGASIEAALLDSEFLIVLCSPRSAQSKWVNREVAFFKRRRDPSRILTLIVGGEPMASTIPGREAEECFPKALLFKVGDDLTPGAEAEDAPLAADARETGDGKRGAKLKLAAALLGVGLDDLARRDDRRRAARRRAVLTASLALAAVLGALSLYAFNQRDAAVLAREEAESQRNAALAAQSRAVEARDDAEELIEMILTDLKSDLEGYGTLKSVTAIGNRAIGYYEGQDVRALTPDQLGRRARVLLMLGEADNKRGDLDAALARYETAAATTGEQLARDPGNPQRMFDHAQSVFWVGYIAWQRGDRAMAKRQLTEYHDLAQRLVASDPANEAWQAELDYAYSNLGTLAMDDGDPVAAEEYFRKSLELSLARLAKAPEDADEVWAAGESHAWLADALHRQTRLNEARATREAELRLYERGLHKNPQDARLLLRQISARYRLAQVEIGSGELINALEHAQQSSLAALELLGRDHRNADLEDRASLALSVLGEIYLHLGRVEEARAALNKAVRIAENLVAREDSVPVWSGFNLAQPKLALLEIDARQPRSATLDDLNAFISTQRELVESGITDPSVIRVYYSALSLQKRLASSNGAAWLEVSSGLAARTSQMGPETQILLVEAILRSGNAGDAAEIISRLYAAGCRHPDFIALLNEFPDSQPTSTE